MPTFKGLITEDGLLKLVEYVKSLGPKNGMPKFGDTGADSDDAASRRTPSAACGADRQPAQPRIRLRQGIDELQGISV